MELHNQTLEVNVHLIFAQFLRCRIRDFTRYLSDLAIDRGYQRGEIGRRLQQMTQERLGPRCTLILIAAPAANDYYPAIGYDRCWTLARERRLDMNDRRTRLSGHWRALVERRLRT